MLSVDAHQKIEQLLVEQKLVDKKTLEDVKIAAISEGKPILTALVARNLINSEDLTKVIARSTGVPYVNLTNSTIDQAVLREIPRQLSEQYMAVPLGYMQGRLAVAMLDPNNVQAVDFLSRKINKPLTVLMASQQGISHILSQYSSNVTAEVRSAFKGMNLDEEEEEQAKDTSKSAQKDKAINTIVQDAPISRALKYILEYAMKNGASDIHIEPMEKDLKIRCRIDGILREIMALPKTIEPALVSRIKILSNLKIDEHRIPQDGQFNFESADKKIDLRVAVAPVVWGEQVVLRLLNQSDKSQDLEDLGFKGAALRSILEGAKKPYGMILATGPTGSGKSTTLYTLIQKVKSPEINIVTLEDPVERKIEGVNQMQINTGVGLTFASGLRSILRQDPNVIMVGEIRDKETANLAVQAALTGHLVLSTLHTNSAAGVLPRLLDMGIEPFLIASTVNTVIGQRLVRRVCKDKEEYKSSPSETESIKKVLKNVLPATKKDLKTKEDLVGYENLPTIDQKAYTLTRGKESDQCPGGYKGRMGIYEVFSMSDSIEKLLTNRATSGQIHDQAQAEGMLTMKQDGYIKALMGQTTLTEIARVASDDL
jgi:type IV pilus assembly protein PilB